jgi:hypothetical protein
MGGVRIRQAETRQRTRLEHKASGWTSWRPEDTTQWTEKVPGTSVTIDYHNCKRWKGFRQGDSASNVLVSSMQHLRSLSIRRIYEIAC